MFNLIYSPNLFYKQGEHDEKSKAMLFIAPALFSYALASQACTTLAIQDKQGDIFHGRTLEYMQDLPSWLTYYPAGTQFDKKTPDGSQE